MRRPVFVCAVLALGCLREGDALTESEFCAEYAVRQCARVAQTCGFPQDSCVPIRERACRDFADKQRTVARPYSAESVPACLKKVSEVYGKLPIPASALADVDDVCSRVYQGGTPANEPCTVDYDCSGQLICDKGRCGPRRLVGSGAGCANIGEICPRTEHCSSASGITLCTRKQEKGATCGPMMPCMDELRCSGVCVERLPFAARCVSHDECQSWYCDPHVKQCLNDLAFAPGSPSCLAYMGSATPPPDSGAD